MTLPPRETAPEKVTKSFRIAPWAASVTVIVELPSVDVNIDITRVTRKDSEGQEFTMDILADFDGKVINVVPRERIEVRAGEINKGRTVKEERLIEYGKVIVEKLGGIGPITIQCFIKGNEIKFIEINPRIGGGYPLSFVAGANYPELLIRMVLGEKIVPRLGEFEENLIMLRWEDAVFIKEENMKDNGS